MIQKIINIDPEILGGTLFFTERGFPIKNLFDYLETGEKIDEFLDDFEGVERVQVIKLLELSEKPVESSTGILYENVA